MKKLLLVLLVTLGLQTQAQVSPCDSISYTITSSVNTNILQLNGVITGVCPVNFPCVVSNWSWSVCDDALCFSDTGQVAYFQQFNTSDTLKVCLTTYMTIDTMTYTCMQCDSLVFGPNGWMLLNISNPTGINENQFIFTPMTYDPRKMYDLLGRELNEIPLGTMYIRNGKLYITR